MLGGISGHAGLFASANRCGKSYGNVYRKRKLWKFRLYIILNYRFIYKISIRFTYKPEEA